MAKDWAKSITDPEARAMCEEAGERVLRLGFSLPELRQGKLPKGKWASFDYAFGEVITINEKNLRGMEKSSGRTIPKPMALTQESNTPRTWALHSL